MSGFGVGSAAVGRYDVDGPVCGTSKYGRSERRLIDDAPSDGGW